MSNITTNPFAWGQIELSETVLIDGLPHVTRRAVGEWLEYETDPKDRIRKLIERNPHIEKHSTVVNLTAHDGRNRDVFVYHPIGFLLIVMESGQPKAKTKKLAVAEFVWHLAGPKKLSFKEEYQLRNQRISILTKIDKATSRFARYSLLEDLRHTSLELGIAVPDVLLLNNEDEHQHKLDV